MIFVFFSHVQKISSKFYINTSIFSLPSSTISSYFNSSYHSFLTFLTLYLISFKISQKKISHVTQWGVLTPKTPLAYTSEKYSNASKTQQLRIKELQQITGNVEIRE